MTNDLDRDLRDTFHRHEKDLLGRGPTPAPNMFRRIRRRQAGTVLMAAVAAAAITIAGISGLDAIRASEQTPASFGPPPTASDPFVSIHAQLDEQLSVDLFEVRAEQPSYWRLYALDQFDGSRWTSSDPSAANRGQVITARGTLDLSDLSDVPQDTRQLAQTYTILHDLDGPWLPMAYPPETITLASGEVTFDPVLSQALLDGGPDEGLEYTVESRIVNPSPQELDEVVFLSAPQYGRYTEVPGSVDPRVGELAERWTRDEVTAYRKILAIQRRFVDGSFLYSTDVVPGSQVVTSDVDPLLDFLTTSRRGFCQQFATAMAIMVRALGYPARVAVGYRSGTLNDGVYTVETKDAHAWVEVFFPGYGWLPFEPTPSRTNPIAAPGTYLNPG